MQIRKADAEDLPEIIKLDAVAGACSDRFALLRDAIATGECILAVHGKSVLGYLVLNHSFYEHSFIALLYVSTASRRQGIGSSLLRAAEATCRTAKLFTSTNQSNHAMLALLKASGWQPSGVIHNLDPGDPELVYVRLREGAV